MTNKVKIILSAVGICAVAVPLLLLTLLTKKVDVSSSVPQENRSIDQGILQKISNSVNSNTEMLLPSPSPLTIPSPSPSSPSAVPASGTRSAF